MQGNIEWLVKQLIKDGVILVGSDYELIEQAKQMEKEKTIYFAKHCLDKALDLDVRTAFENVENYYEQRFENE